MGRSWPGSLLWGPLGARTRVQGRRRTERSARPAPRLVSASWMSGVAGSSRAVAPSVFQEAGGAPSPATRVGSPACLSAPTGIGEAAAPSKVRTLGPGPRACPRGAAAAGTTAWPEPASALPCAASGTPPPPSQPCVSRPGLRGLRRGPEGGAAPPPGSWSLTPGLTPALPGLTGRRPRLPSGEAEPRRRRHVGPRCPEPLRGEQPPGPPHPAAPRRPAVSPLGGGQVAGSTPGCCPCPGPRGRASWVRTSPSRSLLLGTSPPRPGPRKTALSKGVALVMWLGVCRLGFSS